MASGRPGGAPPPGLSFKFVTEVFFGCFLCVMRVFELCGYWVFSGDLFHVVFAIAVLSFACLCVFAIYEFVRGLGFHCFLSLFYFCKCWIRVCRSQFKLLMSEVLIFVFWCC